MTTESFAALALCLLGGCGDRATPTDGGVDATSSIDAGLNDSAADANVGETSGDGGSTCSSGVVWCGNYETGDLSQYPTVQASQNTFGSVTVVTTPVRAGAFAGAFTVTNSSTQANCPVLGSPTHPNDLVQSPRLFAPGDDFYIGFSTLFPTGFPVICPGNAGGCFFQIAEIYGPPYGGSAPIGIDVVSNGAGTANRLVFARGAANNYDHPWTSSTDVATDGKTWEDIVLHVHFATDNTGLVELWHNGMLQTLSNGKTTINYPTLESGVNWDATKLTPNALYNSQYRCAPTSAGGPAGCLSGSITIYHDEAKVGTSYAAVAP